MQKEEIGNIHIGISEILTDKVLPNALKNFSVYKPKVSCHFEVGNTDELPKKLMQKHNLDFVISGEPMDMSQLQFQCLYHEEIKFIVHGDHGVNCKIRNHLQANAIHIVFIIYKKMWKRTHLCLPNKKNSGNLNVGLLLKRQNPGHVEDKTCFGFCLFSYP